MPVKCGPRTSAGQSMNHFHYARRLSTETECVFRNFYSNFVDFMSVESNKI